MILKIIPEQKKMKQKILKYKNIIMKKMINFLKLIFYINIIINNLLFIKINNIKNILIINNN